MGPALITFLSDFGMRDPSVAICRGVILSIAPAARIIDITHEIPKFSIRVGAFELAFTVPHFPIAVHLAVVDPGVGTERHPIVVETRRGDRLVGPDNGLLMLAAERLGGPRAAHLLETPAYRRATVSTVFHGRDIFAPAAAHLVAGVPIADLGRSIDVTELVRLDWPANRIGEGLLETSVLYLDSFGNARLAATPDLLAQAVGSGGGIVPWGTRLRLEFGARVGCATAGPGGARAPDQVADDRAMRQAVARRGFARPAILHETAVWADTFGRVEPGTPLVFEDSYGQLCLADNQGSIARRLGLVEDQAVWIRLA